MSWFTKIFGFENVNFSKNASISINGQSFSGKNILIKGGTIIIDNETITIDEKEINISINGNVEKMDVGYCKQMEIFGEVKSVKTASGSVVIKKDATHVTTSSGGISVAGDVEGNVSTISGSVKVGGKIHGDARTVSGSVSKF